MGGLVNTLATTGDQLRRANQWGNGMETSSKKRGRNFTPISESQIAVTDTEINAGLCQAMRAVPVKRLVQAAGATPHAVRNWRKDEHGPGFAKSIRAARKVPLIEAAIIELIRQGNKNPQPEKLVWVLLKALMDIKDEGGKAGLLAKRALARFNEAKGRA